MRDKKKTLDKEIQKLKLKKISKKQKLQERGITLIALVVTIIILLILAGVTLNIALSDNGLFSKAKKAAEDYNEKSIEEKLELLYAEKAFDDYNNNTNIKSDVTSLLEEMAEGEITQEDIDKFNEYLETYDEEIKSISSAEDLTKIGTNDEYPIDGVYVQLGNIENITTPIGSEEKPFKGVYNGNGKSINNLELTSEEDYTGMFRANEGTIKNVTIDNCNISSTSIYVGAITGENTGIIENCTISNGSVTSEQGKGTNSLLGGICGTNKLDGEIRYCKNSADVKGNGTHVGGICGLNSKGFLFKCENYGNVTGNIAIGGITGSINGGKERRPDCYCRRVRE